MAYEQELLAYEPEVYSPESELLCAFQHFRESHGIENKSGFRAITRINGVSGEIVYRNTQLQSISLCLPQSNSDVGNVIAYRIALEGDEYCAHKVTRADSGTKLGEPYPLSDEIASVVASHMFRSVLEEMDFMPDFKEQKIQEAVKPAAESTLSNESLSKLGRLATGISRSAKGMWYRSLLGSFLIGIRRR